MTGSSSSDVKSPCATRLESSVPADSVRRSFLLQSLFPQGVSAAEMRVPVELGACAAHPSETLGRPARQFTLEVAAGRLCMRRAVEDLGAGLAQGTVVEPRTLVASMTFAEGFCGAVVGEARRFRALGVNAQICGKIVQREWPEFATAEELAWLRGLSAHGQSRAAAVLFSAKEAFYQCHHTLTHEWLESGAVAIHCIFGQGQQGSFRVQSRRDLGVGGAAVLQTTGRFRFDQSLVLTAMAVPAAGMA